MSGFSTKGMGKRWYNSKRKRFSVLQFVYSPPSPILPPSPSLHIFLSISLHLFPHYSYLHTFFSLLFCSAMEGWCELQVQREDGGRFIIDKIAARVHAGWCEAAHRVRNKKSIRKKIERRGRRRLAMWREANEFHRGNKQQWTAIHFIYTWALMFSLAAVHRCGTVVRTVIFQRG